MALIHCVALLLTIGGIYVIDGTYRYYGSYLAYGTVTLQVTLQTMKKISGIRILIEKLHK